MSVQFFNYSTTPPTPEEPLYVGAVLDTYEMNGYDDSDWYAIVWDADKKIVTTVRYDTTAFAAMGRANVDATDDVKREAKAYATKIIFENLKSDHKVPAPGKRVRSLTKRGKAVGAVGTVLRFENSKFDSAWAARYSPTKVAVIKVTDEKSVHCGRNLYVAPDKLEVTDDLDDAREFEYLADATQYAHTHDFRDLFHGRWGKVYRAAELYR